MPMMNLSAPSSTAAHLRCPQCNGTAHLTVIEPDVREPQKEWHVFRCENCWGMSRSLLNFEPRTLLVKNDIDDRGRQQA